MDYHRRVWLDGTFHVDERCIFGELIRTNNDLEGWHRRFNGKLPHKNPNMCTLIEILYRESKLVEVTAILVADYATRRHQRRGCRNGEVRIIHLVTIYRP